MQLQTRLNISVLKIFVLNVSIISCMEYQDKVASNKFVHLKRKQDIRYCKNSGHMYLAKSKPSTKLGPEQTCSGQTDFEQMAQGQLNLKEMDPEQMGSGKMRPAKINALRNGCIYTQYLKSHNPILYQNMCAAVIQLNCRR